MALDDHTYEPVRPLDYSEVSEATLGHHDYSSRSNEPLKYRPTKPSVQEPQGLRRIKYLSSFGQILLAIFPLLFIALAAIAISLDKTSISKTGSIVQQTIEVSPTVFPIIFAAIIGKLFRSVGLYWAERGVKLGILERLIGSQTVFSAIQRQVLLGGQYFLGVLIILLWALSPLGGQSALRLLTVSSSVSSTNTTIRYLPIALSLNSFMSPVTDSQLGAKYSWPNWGSIFMTALTTSSQYQNSPQDLFGNVKIPNIDALASLSHDSWTAVNHSENIPYSSLLGIPIGGIPASGNTSFDLISRYFSIRCESSKNIISIPLDDSDFNNTYGRVVELLVDNPETSFAVHVPTSTSESGPEMDTLYNETAIPFNIVSMNSPSKISNFSFVGCSIEPHDVESSVLCTGRLCNVIAMKNHPIDPYSWRYANFYSVVLSLYWLPFADLPPSGWAFRNTSSLSEMWLQYPYTTWEPTREPSFSNLSQVPLATLSRNLEILYNTYWQSTYGFRYLPGSLNEDVTDSFYDDLAPTDLGWPPINFNTSEATLYRQLGEHYNCSMRFATILIAISCLLVLASLLSITLMNLTYAPDVLGYVASFTRDNPFATFDQASYMDGLERARELREMKVIVGDVNMRGDIGHIAFAATVGVQRLRGDRFYD